MANKTDRKNKIQNCYGMKDMYNAYIQSIDIDSPYYVTSDEYYRMCGDYYKGLIRKIMFDGYTIKLPFRLGHLSIMKKRPRRMLRGITIDWAETKKYGKWIRYINDHTAGFRFRFFWSKKQCMVVNREMYNLRFTRGNKRMLAKLIKTGNVDFLEIR
jgi:hypothetical protein